MMAATNPNHGRWLTVATIFRGASSPEAIYRSLLILLPFRRQDLHA
jgi:hypothetical protein